MIKKPLMEKIYLEVAERVADLGFTKRFKKGNACRKVFPWGFQSVRLCYITHPTDFDVTVELGIRFDADVEMITSNKNISSFGVNLGNWMGIGQNRWKIEKEADIAPAADDIVATFKEYGLEYLDKYSSMEEVWLTITGQKNQGEERYVMKENFTRAQSIITMAIILNKPNLEKIIQDAREFIANCDSQTYPARLDEFIKSLDIEEIKRNLDPKKINLVRPTKLGTVRKIVDLRDNQSR